MSEEGVPKTNGSYTLYDDGKGNKVTLTFPGNADFEVVKKTLDTTGLPTNINWVVNFGIKNPGGNYVPGYVAYDLDATGSKSWYIYYKKEDEDYPNSHPLKGHHKSPSDPPIGDG